LNPYVPASVLTVSPPRVIVPTYSSAPNIARHVPAELSILKIGRFRPLSLRLPGGRGLREEMGDLLGGNVKDCREGKE
jgi:hypothetical protein